MRVDFPKDREFFLQNNRDSHDLGRPPSRSDGREQYATWPRWRPSFGAAFVVREIRKKKNVKLKQLQVKENEEETP